MGIFEDTISKAREIANETSKMAGEAISLQKLKFKLSSEKTELQKNYGLLGEYTFNEKVGGENNSEAIEALIETIKSKKEEIENLKKEIAKARGEKICSCGAPNKDEAKFCTNCGKEL